MASSRTKYEYWWSRDPDLDLPSTCSREVALNFLYQQNKEPDIKTLSNTSVMTSGRVLL